jgi:hypothetical protein
LKASEDNTQKVEDIILESPIAQSEENLRFDSPMKEITLEYPLLN